MSIQLDKDAYIKLIDEDIKWLEQQGSEHSLERKHIKAVLEWSIEQLYNQTQIQFCNVCPDCLGKRYVPDVKQTTGMGVCPTCFGNGIIPNNAIPNQQEEQK